jgi:hypothetical protein
MIPYSELSEIEQLRRDKESLQRQLDRVDDVLKWKGTGRGRVESLTFIEMRLCETERLILKPDQLYRFTVDPNCTRCNELHKK